MRTLSLTIFLFFFSFLSSCQSRKVSIFDKPQKVVITGEVINRSSYDPNSIAVIIDDVASSEQLRVVSDLDKDGNFEAHFDRFFPQEVMLKYNTIYKVFVHPGDSLHIKIDAKKQGTQEECFHSISFSGDAAGENEKLTKFREWFSPIKTKKSYNQIAESRYNPERYLQYRDSLRKSYHQTRAEFVRKNNVTMSLDKWMYYEIENDYFYNLYSYPMVHRRLNNYPSDWEAPISYYDFFKTAKIDLASLCNAGYTKPFALNYFYVIRKKIESDLRTKGLVQDTVFQDGSKGQRWKVNNDSIIIDGIKKYTSEGLLRQLEYNLLFRMKFRQTMKTDFYEKNSNLISQEIKEPFLVEPLQKIYQDIREMANNPQNNGKPLIVDSAKTPGSDILKQIVESNKGKVIYIDCWATWCGPCIAEMPYSKRLMNELRDEPVTFVYLSFNSPQKEAQYRMNDLKMGGTHYFLNVDQGNHLQIVFAFSSFPNYVLIDKKGVMVKSSPDLLPESGETKKLILNLLKQKVD